MNRQPRSLCEAGLAYSGRTVEHGRFAGAVPAPAGLRHSRVSACQPHPRADRRVRAVTGDPAEQSPDGRLRWCGGYSETGQHRGEP
jgi:hypothetical protein